MAIIKSLAIGKAVKSAGNLTFRVVRGRTIVSERVTSRPATRSDSQTRAQENFTKVTNFNTLVKEDINLSFDKSLHGSERNNFFKINKEALYAAFESLPVSGIVTLEEYNAALEAYVTSPEAKKIYRVKKTGTPRKYLTGAWSSNDNPIKTITGITYNGIEMKSGTNIVLASGQKIRLTGNDIAVDKITFDTQDAAGKSTPGRPFTEVFSVVNSGTSLLEGTVKVTLNHHTIDKMYYDGKLFLAFLHHTEEEEEEDPTA